MKTHALRHTLFVVLTLLILSHGARAQVWERTVGPGLTFRMEREPDPQRNIYGLRVDLARVRLESALARKSVYDLSPLNGRDVLSNMVREQGAIAGINGDFFQFGDDPGGDPKNLMVRGGELLSHPGTGARGVAVGWGDAGKIAFGNGGWSATFQADGGGRQSIDALNTRVETGLVALQTDTAGYVYAAKGIADAVAVRVRAGAYRLGTQSRLAGVVTEIVAVTGRVRVAPGEFLLTAAGARAQALKSLRPGAKIAVDVSVSGFDWSRARDICGGGPVLLRDGKDALAKGANDFNDTRHPRTALGQASDGSLWLVVVDGRQSMSAGASLAELTQILRRWGCVDAINLDGGGSSSLHLLGATLNRPSGGVERAIANGILLYGDRPTATPGAISIRAPQAPILAGQSVRLTALRDNAEVPATNVVFAATGAGWIDPDGNLRAVAPGTVEIVALVDGVVARLRLEISAPK